MKKILIFLLLTAGVVFGVEINDTIPVSIDEPGYLFTHTKIVYKYHNHNEDYQNCSEDFFLTDKEKEIKYQPQYDYLILDISDDGTVKVLKRYSEEEWNKVIK
jgi:hypothetical protein